MMETRQLKIALLANATFSLISGISFILLAEGLAGIVGLGTPIVYQGIGVVLLLFAANVVWTATRTPVNTFDAMLVSVADFGWALGTLVLIAVAFGALTLEGILLLLAIAMVVGCFGIWQMHGIGATYAMPGKPGTHKLCVAIPTPQRADAMWDVIADLPRINAYSPNLTHVILRDKAQSGVDAVRQCTNVKGETWGEHCTRFDPDAREVVFEFLADEPGFPYPFKTMVGGWTVTPNKVGSTVHIWFEVTPKVALMHPFILAVMARGLAESFAETVARMSAAANGDTVSVEIPPAYRKIVMGGALVACT